MLISEIAVEAIKESPAFDPNTQALCSGISVVTVMRPRMTSQFDHPIELEIIQFPMYCMHLQSDDAIHV